ERSREIGTLWGDAASFAAEIKAINDTDAGLSERLSAIAVIAQRKGDDARAALLKLVSQPNPEALLKEGLRGLGNIGGSNVSAVIIARWKDFPLALRQTGADVLVSRREWT